jgi:hypothetical protein
MMISLPSSTYDTETSEGLPLDPVQGSRSRQEETLRRRLKQLRLDEVCRR